MTDPNGQDKGSKFKVTFTGDTHIEHQHIGDIIIEQKYLSNMPEHFSKSLQEFESTLNNELQKEKENIKPGADAPVNQKLNELAKEATQINEKPLDEEKKNSIREKLKTVARALVKMSPKIVTTVIKVTPLSPFADSGG